MLTLRGLRTLAPPRMRAHQENADAILALLQQQPRVTKFITQVYQSTTGTITNVSSMAGAMLSFEVDF